MSEIKKTGYQWCFDSNIRIVDLSMYDLQLDGRTIGLFEDDFFEIEVTRDEFINAIRDCTIKDNSTPRKTEKYLEYRMYGLVPYNLSEIQKGIQYGHGVVEYHNKFVNLSPNLDRWALIDKTFIILNGGTTNENKESKFYGSMQQHRNLLVEKGIDIAEFKEPDLNDTLTAVVFLVDERVYDKEIYPDFIPTPLPMKKWFRGKIMPEAIEKNEKQNEENYAKWVEKIGGENNAFLRDFLKDFRLA